jgi:hypothetical protein
MRRQETGPARQALRALLQGRLVFAPQERERQSFYTFSGEGTITPVIAGTVSLQHVWCPRRDSLLVAALPIRGIVYRYAA